MKSCVYMIHSVCVRARGGGGGVHARTGVCMYVFLSLCVCVRACVYIQHTSVFTNSRGALKFSEN